MDGLSLTRRAALVMTLACPAAGLALDSDYVPDADAVEVDETRPDGWSHALDLGAALQIGGSHQVVGQPDGATVTISLSLAYTGELWRGSHELRLTGSLVEAISRTPVIDDFVKSNDTLQLESIYYYHLPSAPWFGPFARASLRTAIFPGADVRAEEVTYIREGETISSSHLRLTDAFSPLYLKQSVGVFARPYDEEVLAIDFRLGAGAREVFADGSFVIDDDDATDEIEVSALNSYTQAGGEFAVDLYGSTDGGDITYGANYEMMIPFYDSLDSDLDPIPATNYEIGANFGARLAEWASIQYELGLLRIPQIVEEWQVTNSLLLSFNYGIRRGVGADE